MTDPEALVDLLIHVESLPLRHLRLGRRRTGRPHRRRGRILDDPHIGADLRAASCRGGGHRSHVFREHKTRGKPHLSVSSRRVDWRVVGRLVIGSVPATGAVILWFWLNGRPTGVVDQLISRCLAIILALAAVALLMQNPLRRLGLKFTATWLSSTERHKVALTVAAGALLGFGVALTSVGAGALGVAVLVALYPLRLTSDRLVATDIAHALPITAIAAAGHAILGHVDLRVLACLLVGSIPGVIFATRATIRLPPRLTRTLIAIMLAFVSERLFVA